VNPELTALIPVDEAMAHNRRPPWNMPDPAVLRRLNELTQGRVIRSDLGLSEKAPGGGVVRFPGAVRVMPLFIDVTVPKAASGRGDRVRQAEEVLRGPILDNYDGYATVRLTDESGVPVDGVAPGGRCRLTIDLVPDEPPDQVAERIVIDGGENVQEVVFDVVPDAGDQLSVTPRRGTVIAQADGTSRAAEFTLTLPDYRKAKSYPVYVQMYQKTQFVCVLRVDLAVQGPRGRAAR
jgi:hypothetical protein